MSRLQAASAPAWSVAAATGWLLLAVANPGTTYHLAPLVVALAWPSAARARTSPTRWRQSFTWVLGGCLVAAAAAAVLHARGDLSGPVLLGGSAPVEAGLVGAVGAVTGLWLARPVRDQVARIGASDH